MPYFEYTPGDEAQSVPERLALIANDDEDPKAEKLKLFKHVVDSCLDGEITEEDLDAYHKASSDDLPVKTTSLANDSAELLVIDHETGLSMNSVDNSTFEIQSVPIDVGKLRADDEWIAFGLVYAHNLNRQAWQVQPGTAWGAFEHTEHISLGYATEDGDYQPFVTVLADTHPAVQRKQPLVRAASGPN